jgi:hypothetical protein
MQQGNLCKGYVVYSWLFTSVVKIMGKVCSLCRVLETGISVVLMVKRSLRILFD